MSLRENGADDELYVIATGSMGDLGYDSKWLKYTTPRT